MSKRYNTIKKLVREDRTPYTGKRDFNGGWRKKVIAESDWIPELLNPVKSTITSSGFDDIKKKLSFRKLVEKESSETVFQVQQPYIKNIKISDSIFDNFSNISNWREELIDEGMSSKDFPDLYGYGISIFDMPITSTIQTPVQSTKAQDIVDASADATDHEFGPQFPGSYRNVIGGVQSLSKVDVQAHITTPQGVTPNEGEMAHPEKHVFTYQSEGNSIKWPTEFTLPDSFNDDLMWYDADGNPQEWIHYIWPVHGHPGNYTPLDSDNDDTPFWYDIHPHDSPGSAWGYNSETDSDDKFRLRMTFNEGRIDRRSITDTSFDVTYGAARSIDSSAFDLTGNMDEQPFAQGYETDYNLDVNDIAAVNALRLQWEKPTSETGHEDWQYINTDTSTDYIDQLYGIDFPFAEYDYSPYESDHGQYTGTDGWDRIHPNVNTDASFAKKIIKNVQVGDKISFSYKWYSDAWLYSTENYSNSLITDDYVHDGVRYGDHDWNPSYFRAVIGANNKVVSIKDQWQMIGADPSLTLTDGTYTIPPLPNPDNPEDNDLYNEYNITKKDNGFSFPYNGTYEYTVQEGDIDAAGLFQFTTILLTETTNLEYVQVTNFAHTIGDQTRTAAGQLGKTTDAYNLGTSVASLDPNKKKKKKKDEEEDSTDTKPSTTSKKDKETDPTQDSEDSMDPQEMDPQEKEIIDQEIEDENEKESESIPQDEKEEKKVLDDAKEEEQKEDEEIEKEKESDEREKEKEKFIDEFEGDEEEKNIFSQLLDSALDYAAKIKGHQTSKAVLELYNKFIKGGANQVYGRRDRTFLGPTDWESIATVDAAGRGGYVPGMNPVVYTNRDGDVDLRRNRVISDSDMTYLRSALNDPKFEKIHERAMNAKNEKSKQLYLHALADVVEDKIENQILRNKGLEHSLFQGIKLDRNAFLQSNGKYISFTKTYQFRSGGSVADAEKSWLGKALTALGIDLDTLGKGDVIDMIGGVVAGKLLVDGSDKFGGLYKSPPMRMRLNLHYRGGGNTSRLPYKSSSNSSGYVNKGAWWEEDAEVGKKQLSSYEYSQNWTPEAIGPYHSLNPRTGRWERPNERGRFGRDWEGQTDRERAVSAHDDFWWLDPNFKDLTKFADKYDKKDNESINDVSDVSATDAATLASERKKKKRKKGQGGRELGDTTKRGGFKGVSTKRVGDEIAQEPKSLLQKGLEKQERDAGPMAPMPIIKDKPPRGGYRMPMPSGYDLLDQDPKRTTLARGKGKRGRRGTQVAHHEPKGEMIVDQALYPDQPSPNGFPDTPPPKLAPNGYHPQFGKRADRYRRLDPISAKTMDRVKTGDPETDAQVSAAAKSVFERFKKYR